MWNGPMATRVQGARDDPRASFLVHRGRQMLGRIEASHGKNPRAGAVSNTWRDPKFGSVTVTWTPDVKECVVVVPPVPTPPEPQPPGPPPFETVEDPLWLYCANGLFFRDSEGVAMFLRSVYDETAETVMVPNEEGVATYSQGGLRPESMSPSDERLYKFRDRGGKLSFATGAERVFCLAHYNDRFYPLPDGHEETVEGVFRAVYAALGSTLFPAGSEVITTPLIDADSALDTVPKYPTVAIYSNKYTDHFVAGDPGVEVTEPVSVLLENATYETPELEEVISEEVTDHESWGPLKFVTTSRADISVLHESNGELHIKSILDGIRNPGNPAFTNALEARQRWARNKCVMLYADPEHLDGCYVRRSTAVIELPVEYGPLWTKNETDPYWDTDFRRADVFNVMGGESPPESGNIYNDNWTTNTAAAYRSHVMSPVSLPVKTAAERATDSVFNWNRAYNVCGVLVGRSTVEEDIYQQAVGSTYYVMTAQELDMVTPDAGQYPVSSEIKLDATRSITFEGYVEVVNSPFYSCALVGDFTLPPYTEGEEPVVVPLNVLEEVPGLDADTFIPMDQIVYTATLGDAELYYCTDAPWVAWELSSGISGSLPNLTDLSWPNVTYVSHPVRAVAPAHTRVRWAVEERTDCFIFTLYGARSVTPADNPSYDLPDVFVGERVAVCKGKEANGRVHRLGPETEFTRISSHFRDGFNIFFAPNHARSGVVLGDLPVDVRHNPATGQTILLYADDDTSSHAWIHTGSKGLYRLPNGSRTRVK